MAINSKNAFYLGDESLPTKNMQIEASPEQIKQYAHEMKRCQNNLLYFAENYFYIINPDEGRIKIKLHKYQKRFLKTIKNNRFVIFNTSRQVGKSTLLTIYALWYVLNNPDKTVLLLANKQDTAIEIFGRIKMAYKELPNWLKPGVEKWDQTKMILTNGSKIIVSTTTESAARGFTINLLLLDEFAFVECLDFDTKIKIRNKTTKIEEEISIGDLYLRLLKNS